MLIRTYSDINEPLQWTLPDHACDAHVHVFGPGEQFPYAPERKFTPVDAPKEKLFSLHQRLGIKRCVIVQTMLHGIDNSVVADAIAAGGGRYLGVALIRPDISLAELKTLARQGFRAVRFNFTARLGQGISPEDLPGFTKKLADAGLHLQVHFEPQLIHTLAPMFKQSAVTVVIDHMGRVDARQGENHADFQALTRLLEHPLFYVKISGIDRVDATVPLETPPYQHGIHLARFLLERFPTQCVWGTDWPHPNHTHIPDDGVLLNAIPHIASSPALQHALLVDNPQTLYQFEAS